MRKDEQSVHQQSERQLLIQEQTSLEACEDVEGR